MEIVKLSIEDIKPYTKNAKKHPQEQIEQIKKSIQEFGMNDPIAIWGEKNIVVEGHGRLEALKQLGYTEVDCIRLDHLTDEERKAYTLVHNKLTMNTDFDDEILNSELFDIKDIDMSFYDFNLDLGIDEQEAEEDDFDIDESLKQEVKTKVGQIYQLGSHRLMCGDSTNLEDVMKLMNGEVADLLYTDPPYNVDVSNSKGMKIENDNMSSQAFKEFLQNAFQCASNSLKQGGAFYIWHADSESINFRQSAIDNGLLVKQCLIWVKNSFNFGRQDYKWQHEPCLYGWKEGAGHYFVEEYNHPTVIEDKPDYEKMKKDELVEVIKQILDSGIPTTVIHEKKPLANDLHPTMKPLKMCANMIRNSSKVNELVLDLFGGSGSTMVACEQINRRCYMMEYDPKYCDVIVDRWEKLTGQKAVLLNG